MKSKTEATALQPPVIALENALAKQAQQLVNFVWYCLRCTPHLVLLSAGILS
ncbi:MAG: hypothetical protein K2X77_17920 [Candidatus Obscuribacterales bacterium]|nr:hypothetical protein [Candidatus Obscuribacterales bacterium]